MLDRVLLCATVGIYVNFSLYFIFVVIYDLCIILKLKFLFRCKMRTRAKTIRKYLVCVRVYLGILKWFVGESSNIILLKIMIQVSVTDNNREE